MVMNATVGGTGTIATTLYPAAIHSTDFVFGVISLLCFLIGTPSSLLCLLFFSSKRRKTINIVMFILISVTDLVTCALMLFVGLSAFRVHVLFENPVFCNVWGFSWSVVIQLSIIMIAVLSVTRTASIIYPLWSIRVGATLALLGAYFTFLVVHASVPYWFGVTYSYFRRSARCTWDDIEVYGWGSTGKVVEYVLTPLITYLLPTLTVLVCFCLLISKLLRRTHKQQQRGSCTTRGSKSKPRPSLVSIASTMSLRGDAKIHSTITVLILTIFYLTLTLPSTVIRLVAYTHELYHQEPYKLTVSYDFYRLISTYFLPINSVCNTIVYFVRIRDLRIYTCRLLQRHKDSCRRVSDTARVFANSVAMATTGSTEASARASSSVTLNVHPPGSPSLAHTTTSA